MCMLYRAFMGLPALMEETRKLLTAAPAKGVATYLETDLCADIDVCDSAQALQCVQVPSACNRAHMELEMLRLTRSTTTCRRRC